MGLLSQLFGGMRLSQAEHDCMEQFPFTVAAVPGEQALTRLAELRTPDFSPVILGDGENLLARHALLMTDTYTIEEIFTRMQSIGTPEWWFTARTHALEECFEETLGEWRAEDTPHDTVQAVLDPETGNPLPTVFLTRLPTAHSWEVPMLLRFGGWAESPFPEEHAAIARAWHEQYGAEIIAVTTDTLEFAVANPPTARETAERLAMDHFAYCEGMVTHAAGSIRNLAAHLIHAPYWYFRWPREREG